MSAERYAFDTNILFYSIDPNAGPKYALASRLIDPPDYERVCIPLQCLGELCYSVRRKAPARVAAADALVEEFMQLFDVVPALPQDLSQAIRAQSEHAIPFWDAMLWAAVRRSGCTLLLTEDLQDGRVLGGVTIRNPFALSSKELAPFLR